MDKNLDTHYQFLNEQLTKEELEICNQNLDSFYAEMYASPEWLQKHDKKKLMYVYLTLKSMEKYAKSYGLTFF